MNWDRPFLHIHDVNNVNKTGSTLNPSAFHGGPNL